jgi:hypothetical protein
MRVNSLLDTSHHGPLYPFRNARVVADSLIVIQNTMMKHLFVVKRSCTYEDFWASPQVKNPEDSNLASLEAIRVQWVLYLSTGHEKC